ncbi:MAG: glycoside hydrolase family 9 protein [Cytophagaceae bacterium]
MRTFSVVYTLLSLLVINGFSQTPAVQELIRVDQFGYLCNAQKIAVIANPQTGYNSGLSFTPSATLEVRRWDDHEVVFSDEITEWNGGAVHAQSGDRVWWFDFSDLTEQGSFYVYDPVQNVRSYQFEIAANVYENVMKAAVRSFYYHRCGVAKIEAHAGVGYGDAACHLGNLQDTDCRLVGGNDPATSRDLHGGWHDAGDYNKYVNFTWGALIDLLLAYEENPTVWTDDYNLPESGNGVPDLLDEIKFELDWLLRMQEPNGSVLSVIGGGAGSPPSASNQQRRYGPATTSTSLTFAGVCALGAIQFRSLGIPAMTAYANTLEAAAVNAWNWAIANPNVTWFNGANNLAAGENETDEYGRTVRRIAASCYLYALTGNAAYRNFFEDNYMQVNMMNWWFVFPFQYTIQNTLLYYTKLPGITAAVSNNIWARYNGSMNNNDHSNLPRYTDQTDAYRAFLADNNYVWGSNNPKNQQGLIFMNMITHNRDVPNHPTYRNAASGFIHYMHGVNPIGMVYLTNMSEYGAESSANEVYHWWFNDGSPLWDRVGVSTYGPAPGIVPGGANRNYNWDGCCPGGCGGAANNALCVVLEPPRNQPPQKSYRDWNTGWPQNSWEVTENGIYYQAAYIKLLSKFMVGEGCTVTPVEFVSFTGRFISNTEVKLEWKTAMEINNDRFEVLRSVDGSNFDIVGTVSGVGNSSSLVSYGYVDQVPVNDDRYYYKLRQIDGDGGFSYSTVVEVNRDLINFIRIYPNPVADNVHFGINSSVEGPATIEIISVTGSVVRKENVQLKQGVNDFNVHTTGLSTGIYSVRVMTSDGKFAVNKSFVKE